MTLQPTPAKPRRNHERRGSQSRPRVSDLPVLGFRTAVREQAGGRLCDAGTVMQAWAPGAPSASGLVACCSCSQPRRIASAAPQTCPPRAGPNSGRGKRLRRLESGPDAGWNSRVAPAGAATVQGQDGWRRVKCFTDSEANELPRAICAPRVAVEDVEPMRSHPARSARGRANLLSGSPCRGP
jgi:hypothetical protein